MDTTESMLIRGARVFDGEAMRPRTDVLLSGGRITAIGPDVVAPAGCEVVDGRGQTLLPGLIDAHTHVYQSRLEQALTFGVATELDMCAVPPVVEELKAQAAASAGVADLRSAGIGATAPGGHPARMFAQWYPQFPTLSGPSEADVFVAARIGEGSDYLKVFCEPGDAIRGPLPCLDTATVEALVQAGHEQGLLVLAHATTLASARQAIAAGVDGLAHAVVDAIAPPEFVEAVVAAGVFVIPTLTVLEGRWGTGEGARALAGEEQVAPYLDPVSAGMLTMGPSGPIGGGEGARNAVATVAALYAAGVPILAGTDAANPGTAHGASLHQELRLLVTAGLTPIQALSAATAAPAARFGLSDRGRIAPGYRADLLLVEGDPSRDVTVTTVITGIWRGGTRLDREAPTSNPTRSGVEAASPPLAPETLEADGFTEQKPTIWLLEGLLAYLTPADVESLLDQLTALSAPGSELLGDLVGRSLLASPWMRSWLDGLTAADMPWQFGTDRPEDLLTPRGWDPTVALISTIAIKLGRWPFPEAPRDTPGVPQTFLIHAHR
jgi:imidazolonepropionase-like amidohydrolase